MENGHEYFHGVTKYKIVGLVVMFLFLMVIIGTVRAQDNKTTPNIKPGLQMKYVPAEKNYKAGTAGDKSWWPYPTWQITSWTTKCMNNFPRLVPEIQLKLWPQELFPFCSCIMDRFRQEWAYKDFIANFNERAVGNNSPALNSLSKDYADTCIVNVMEYREKKGFFPNPNGIVPPWPGLPDDTIDPNIQRPVKPL
jgi:hypothetical protein